MAMACSSNTGRLEDIYQEGVINAFVDLSQFKMFARSKNGLCLKESDVQNCDEDNKNSIDKKMAMLHKWQMKNGKDATVSRIRYLVERYHRGDKPKNYMTLREDMFGLFKDKKLCKNSHVYIGEQINAVIGSIPRAMKLIQYEESNLREAQILTTLGHHENVVSVIHVDKCHSEPNDYIYIVMELASSENLRDLLEETKKSVTLLDHEMIIDMAIQILRALVFIHKKNIIHRDLKPENILVSEDRKELKLTDFGISKTISSGSYTRQSNKTWGTDGYKAPESYNNDVISQKSDIFSAGITLAELFSNSRHPFGDNPIHWSYNISTGKTPDLRHIFIANSAPVMKLICQMLLFDPEERPTASEVLIVLQLLRSAMNPAALLHKVHPIFSAADGERQEDQLEEDFQTFALRKHVHPEKIQSEVQAPTVKKKVHSLTSTSEIQPENNAQAKVHPDPSTASEVQLKRKSQTSAVRQKKQAAALKSKVADASTVKKIQTQVQVPAAEENVHLVASTSEGHQTGKSLAPAVRQKKQPSASTPMRLS